MNKKLFMIAIASFSIAFSGLNSLSAHADDIEPHTASDDTIEATSDEVDITTNCLDGDSENPNNCVTATEEIEDGTSDESLVVCADKNEPGCKSETDEADETIADPENDAEPALWPMIISFAALGFAAVVIIILNLTGPKIK